MIPIATDQPGVYESPRGVDPFVAAFASVQRGFWVEEHFVGWGPDGAKSGSQAWQEVATVGGTANVQGSTIVPGLADYYGAASFRIPVNLGGGLDSGAMNLHPELVQVDGLMGRVGAVFRVYIDVLPGAADDSQVIIGLGDTEANFGEPSDGWYFYLDDTIGGVWVLKSARASIRTTSSSGFAPVAGAWQVLGLIADAPNGCVDMYAANDGDPLIKVGRMLVPVNLQPSQEITGICGISSAAGVRANAQNLFCDYAGVGADYGVLR